MNQARRAFMIMPFGKKKLPNTALAATGRRSDMRPAAKAVNERYRDAWRIDF